MKVQHNKLLRPSQVSSIVGMFRAVFNGSKITFKQQWPTSLSHVDCFVRPTLASTCLPLPLPLSFRQQQHSTIEWDEMIVPQRVLVKSGQKRWKACTIKVRISIAVRQAGCCWVYVVWSSCCRIHYNNCQRNNNNHNNNNTIAMTNIRVFSTL